MDLDWESYAPLLRAVVIAVVLIAAFAGYYWLFLRSRMAMLRGWAAENRFQIISSEKHYMVGTGPFKAWTNSGAQLVYFVVLRDEFGHERQCWVRCGSYLGIGSSSNIEVREHQKPA